jgi:hypothetical protein
MDPTGSRKVYFNHALADKIKGWDADKIATLISEGKGLFELTMAKPTKEEVDYIAKHPKLKEVVEFW